MKIGQRKFQGLHAAVFEERQVALVVGLQIMQGDAGKIGNDHVAGNFIEASLAGEVLNVTERLRLRLVEIFSPAFVLDEHAPGPEQIDVTVVAGDFLDRLLEAGDDAAADAEDIKEFVPEGLLFGLFALGARPFF